jgi:hypothetical protein
MTRRRTYKGPNEVRRPRGRPRQKVGETIHEKIHVVLGRILKDCRFAISEREFVKLIYEGYLPDLKKHVILLYNLIDHYTDEDLRKESKYDRIFKRPDESTGGT